MKTSETQTYIREIAHALKQLTQEVKEVKWVLKDMKDNFELATLEAPEPVKNQSPINFWIEDETTE